MCILVFDTILKNAKLTLALVCHERPHHKREAVQLWKVGFSFHDTQEACAS